MAWDFSTEPEFQEKLDWIAAFVKDEVEPIDLAFDGHLVYDKRHPVHDEVVRPLQEQVKAHDLWACHLGPDLGGKGYGQLKLGLMNEILGRSSWAPSVFGCQAPDSGNAEILAHYGTPAQKERYLQPLLDGRIASSFSMTEPQAGADPGQFRCRATQDGDDWVISGEKWFSSNFRYASFAMVITDPDVPVYQGASMFLVPTDTPGIEIVRNVGLMGEREGEGSHAYVRYHDVRVPADHLLGGAGQGFVIAQTRLGGGRIHHAMRTVGMCKRAFDMMCERALSRTTQGEVLARKQMVQEQIADSWIQLQQFRLQVLYAAWVLDTQGGASAAGRTAIAGVKVAMADTLHDIVYRSMHLHGSLGVSNELPLGGMLVAAMALGLADGPSEVHKVTIARQVLKQYKPAEGLFPTEHLPDRRAQARKRFGHLLDLEVGNL
jgi:acyl-CoA dehydrogenase